MMQHIAHTFSKLVMRPAGCVTSFEIIYHTGSEYGGMLSDSPHQSSHPSPSPDSSGARGSLGAHGGGSDRSGQRRGGIDADWRGRVGGVGAVGVSNGHDGWRRAHG